jgi:hypothetical protein
MTRRTLALLVGAALLAPMAGQAQGSEFARQVGVQLVRDARVLIPAGFALSHDPYTGTLYDNTYEDLTLTLHSGVSYALVGVCDNDCSDLDLILYDAVGREVSSALRPDDKPVVVAAPRWTGQYRLRVIMARCLAQPCFYGIGIFGQ